MFFKHKAQQSFFSEREIEQVIKTLQQVLILFDMNQTVLKFYGSSSLAAVFKWSEENMGRRYDRLTAHPFILDLIKEGFDFMLSGEEHYQNHFSLDSNEEKKWFSIDMVRRFNEKGQCGFSILFNEVTENVKKQHEQESQIQELENIKKAMFNLLEDMEQERKTSVALAKDLEKFKLAVEFSSDHVQIVDTDQKVVYMNHAAEQITGFTRKEAIGKGVVNLWRAMDKPLYQQLWHKIHQEKKPFTGEIMNRRKNGEEYPAEVQIFPLLDNKGEIMFYVGIERDITKLKEVDRMKSEFVSVASHQLRTPLSGIKWLTELLLGGKMGELKKEQLEILSEIKDSNERLIALVNDLLDISHIETGQKFVITKASTDLIQIIKTVLKEQKIIAEQKQIEFEFGHPLPKEIMLNIDGEKIRQVVLNYVNNAIKYSNPNTKILIDLTKKNEVIFKVTNYGILISEEESKKIYEKFYRTDSAKTMDPGGSGLGLYIAKAIIEGHGGKIWFISNEKEGTSFYFSLPLE